MNIFIIDNYDSFTYNLYQMIGELLNHEQKHGNIKHFSITVKRNDEVSVDDISKAQPDRIIISPGPGTPTDENYFGVCAQTIKELGKTIPILGVCLGMQGIAHVFGGTIKQAQTPMHGKTSLIRHYSDGIFKDIPNDLEIMRYHSLIVDAPSLPDCFDITATILHDEGIEIKESNNIEIMGIRHKEYPIHGIQFHPESFATEGGVDLIRNFIF